MIFNFLRWVKTKLIGVQRAWMMLKRKSVCKPFHCVLVYHFLNLYSAFFLIIESKFVTDLFPSGVKHWWLLQGVSHLGCDVSTSCPYRHASPLGSNAGRLDAEMEAGITAEGKGVAPFSNHWVGPAGLAISITFTAGSPWHTHVFKHTYLNINRHAYSILQRVIKEATGCIHRRQI